MEKSNNLKSIFNLKDLIKAGLIMLTSISVIFFIALWLDNSDLISSVLFGICSLIALTSIVYNVFIGKDYKAISFSSLLFVVTFILSVILFIKGYF